DHVGAVPTQRSADSAKRSEEAQCRPGAMTGKELAVSSADWYHLDLALVKETLGLKICSAPEIVLFRVPPLGHSVPSRDWYQGCRANHDRADPLPTPDLGRAPLRGSSNWFPGPGGSERRVRTRLASATRSEPISPTS
ncbi:unnamed protein product, partial [Polarella glacialis]